MAANARKEAPMTVDVPSADRDRPSWGRVGAIAVIGFVIGVAWPKLAGVRLGPSAPTETIAANSADLPATAITQPMPSIATPPASSPPAAIVVQVGRGVMISCKTEDGESLKGKECGPVPAFDGIAQPRLRKISTLPALKDAKGKLSVVFALDFKSKKVAVDVGKSSTVKDEGPIKSFLKEQFQDVSLGPLAHDQEKYTMSYTLTVGEGTPERPTGTPSGSTPSSSLAEGQAEIVWDVAIVRDAPHTGAIVARLPRGTKVTLGTSQAGWYKITYGPSSEGWLYRGAVGK